MAGSRRWAWILRGRKAADLAIKACMSCRLRSSLQVQQLMGDVPKHYLKTAAPFSVVAIDLFGPIVVKGIANSQAKIKVWGALYSCLATKAVAVWAVPGYDAKMFLETHSRHTAIYGAPQIALSDHGSQLVVAAKEMEDWERVRSAFAKNGTNWKFTKTGCSWRNGLAERAIKLIKGTLMHLSPELGNLNVLQLETVFLQASMIANRRPIAARSVTQEDYYAITPADLLLGRATDGMLKAVDEKFWLQEQEAADLAPEIRGKLQTIVHSWWMVWIDRAFHLLLPRRKWASQHRDVKLGDIVHLQYK